MNSEFDTSKYKFESLVREEQELLVIDSQLNGVKVEYWAEHSGTWSTISHPRWNSHLRYRRKPELLEQYVNVFAEFTRSYPTRVLANTHVHEFGVDPIRVAVHMKEVRR